MSSVAETIMFIFQADAVRLNKGLDDATKKGSALERQMVSTDTVAERLGSSLIGLAKTAGASLAAAFAASSLGSLATDAAEATNEVRRLAERNNMAVDSYAALRAAVGATGADIEEFQSGLEAFAEKVDNPTKRLQELAEEMEGLTHVQALRLGQELGLSPSTIALLEQGKDSFNGLLDAQRELGSVTAEQAEVARKFQMQQASNNLVWDSLRRSIGLALLPAMTATLEKFQQLGIWIRENRRAILLFVGGLAAVLTAVYLPAIVAAATATLAFLAPWIGAAAIFTAIAATFALLVDDVLAFLDGQDSVIGELSKKWPIIGKNVKTLAGTIQTLWALMKAFGSFIIGAFTDGPTVAFAKFKKSVSKAFDEFSNKFPEVKKLTNRIDEAFTELGNKIGIHLDDVEIIVGGWLETMGSLFGFLYDIITVGPVKAFDNLKSNLGKVFDKILAKFPTLDSAVKNVSGKIATAADIAKTAWNGLLKVINKVISGVGTALNTVKSGVNTVSGWFSDDAGATQTAPPAMPLGVAENMARGSAQVAQAASEPLASTSSSAISNQTSSSRSYTQTIGQVNVHTQAQDGQAVGRDLSENLGEQMRGAIDQFDDGVAA